ncbi:MAG: hypothetical protein ACO1SX_02630 [Actinomycetota bacterium]
MNRLIHSINRAKLPADQQFPLKYTDFETCLTPHLTGNVGLSLHFTPWRVYVDTPAELILPAGDHPLYQMKFDPEQAPWSHKSELWGEPGSMPVLDVRVYGLPREAMRNAGIDHSFVRDELARSLARLRGHGLWEHRWELCTLLRGDRCELECWERTWTGLRPEDERRRHVPLDPARSKSRP